MDSPYQIDPERNALARALFAAALLDSTDTQALARGLEIENIDDPLAHELQPWLNAIVASQLAWRGLSPFARRRLEDPRRAQKHIAQRDGFRDVAARLERSR